MNEPPSEPSTIWVDRWFSSSAGTFLELIRAQHPNAQLIYTHRAPDRRAQAVVDLCLRDVPTSVDDVVGFAADHHVDVLVPARDVELAARSAGRLSAHGTAVALPTRDLAVLATMRDKHRTYQACNEHQLAPTPQWLVANNGAELIEAVAEWTERGQLCCIKPTIGEGAAGFRVIDPGWNPSDELLTWPSTRLSPVELERLVAGLTRPLPPMLVSDFLPGEETSIDVASCHGEVVACVTRRKQSATTQVIERDLTAEEIVAAMSKRWALHGCWNAQFKVGEDGRPRLLEVNPRPAVGSLHTAESGPNFPALGVALAWGTDVTPIDPPDGLLLHRHQTVEQFPLAGRFEADTHGLST